MPSTGLNAFDAITPMISTNKLHPELELIFMTIFRDKKVEIQ